MKKKLLMAVAALFAVLTFADTANAGCNGIYMGLRGGWYKPKMGGNGATGAYDIGGDSWGLGIGLGYRYEYVRAELEYIIRGSASKRRVISGDIAEEKFKATSYMLNGFWDLSPYTMFTPYLMAGVGYSEMEGKITYPYNPLNGFSNFEDSDFTWSLGAGLSAKVTTRFNVDLGYRYFDFGKIEESKVKDHEVYLGGRYVF